MKFSIKAGLSILLIALTSSSYANYTFHVNNCDEIAGKWAGTGEASNWMVDCTYQGTGLINTVDNTGNFSLTVNVDKVSGSFMCPSHHEDTLQGTCTNGNVVIATGYGDLTGVVSHNAGTAKGKVELLPGVGADVTIKLQRNQ